LQVGQRQPAKRSTLERKTKEASTQNAQYTKWLALGLVAVLSGGCQSSSSPGPLRPFWLSQPRLEG
jgi:hypothetical protein